MNLKEVIQKRAKNYIMLNIGLIIICALLFGFIITRKSVTESFKPVTEIHTYDELNVARYNSKYVRVYFEDAYETGYVYNYDGKTVAEYIDFDIDGYSLVGIVKKDEVKKIIDGSKKYVEGRLEKFTGENKSAFDEYVKDYVNKYKDEYDESELKSIFVPIQLNNYDYQSSIGGMYFVLIALAVITVVWIINIVITIPKLKNPFKKFGGEDEASRLIDEFDKEKFKYQTKLLYITDNYFYYITNFKVEIKELKDLKWMYFRNVKQNFVTTYKGTVFAFGIKGNLQIPIQDEKIFEIVSSTNPDVLLGYSMENIKEYNKYVKELKREKKNGI